MPKTNRNPFAGVIARAMAEEKYAIVKPATAAGRRAAEKEFKADFGSRFIRVVSRGYIRNDPAQGECFWPHLRRAKA